MPLDKIALRLGWAGLGLILEVIRICSKPLFGLRLGHQLKAVELDSIRDSPDTLGDLLDDYPDSGKAIRSWRAPEGFLLSGNSPTRI